MQVRFQTSGLGNRRLEPGNVTAPRGQTIEARIGTVGGSLVATCKVDRRTGGNAPTR
jgi:hypothetical protein